MTPVARPQSIQQCHLKSASVHTPAVEDRKNDFAMSISVQATTSVRSFFFLHCFCAASLLCLAFTICSCGRFPASLRQVPRRLLVRCYQLQLFEVTLLPLPTPTFYANCCPLYARGRDGKHARRIGEMAHPFTTCSSHDVVVNGATPDIDDAIDLGVSARVVCCSSPVLRIYMHFLRRPSVSRYVLLSCASFYRHYYCSSTCPYSGHMKAVTSACTMPRVCLEAEPPRASYFFC